MSRARTEDEIVRVTRDQAAENRERIVAVAARLFRERGFEGVGVDTIMAQAGLTHGGFYRHFPSKQDLAAEAVTRELAAGAERQAAYSTLWELVARYLSPWHRDHPGAGCMVAALGCDMARQGAGVRAGITGYARGQIERLAGLLSGGSAAARRERAIATLAGLTGALVLARAVDDPALSDEILAACRAAFGAPRAP